MTKPKHKIKLNPITVLDAWEKLPKETSRGYEAFCAYRDQGPARSLSRTVPILYPDLHLTNTKPNTKRGRLSEWSRGFNWVARCTEFDVFTEKKERIENEKAIKAMSKRHANEALMLQQKAIDRIKLIGLDNEKELTPRESLEFLREAVKIERLSRGVPEQHVEVSGALALSHSAKWVDDIPEDNEIKDSGGVEYVKSLGGPPSHVAPLEILQEDCVEPAPHPAKKSKK